MANNLISTISRYAFRQEENFLTETLVYLINMLIERDIPVGLEILKNLCGEDVRFYRPQEINISTQISTEEGKPDVVVKVGDDKVVFIEVKLDSGIGEEQLERYHAHLQSLQAQAKQLVLLTRSRHSIQETNLDQALFHHVCWYEISGWLSEADIHDEIAQFLVDQFLEFLKEKEMSMEKVTWEYIQGIPAMVNLINMIGTATSEVTPESNTRKTIGASWAGFYVDRVFIGTRFANPLVIVFENNNGANPTFTRELSLEKAHFFSLTAGEQLECLIEFIRKAYSDYSQQ